MNYTFNENKGARTLLLFHGTGGSPSDLIPLAKQLDHTANIIAFEGDVNERGLKRFFKRRAPGVFDLDDLRTRSKNIKKIIDDVVDKHELDDSKLVAIGYSNGANLITSTLFSSQNLFEAVFLHHPMLPYEGEAMLKQEGLHAFISAGVNDPICPPNHTETIESLLKNASASPVVFWHEAGHTLTHEEVEAAKQFYQTNLK